ncbi:MAG: hypothetical protein JRS35_28415, partial [Deltaproteobacteria bacterium]|nr:hypothetical protein [Deltaproteobacteria bacterium]
MIRKTVVWDFAGPVTIAPGSFYNLQNSACPGISNSDHPSDLQAFGLDLGAKGCDPVSRTWNEKPPGHGSDLSTGLPDHFG